MRQKAHLGAQVVAATTAVRAASAGRAGLNRDSLADRETFHEWANGYDHS
jgi:2-methylcitrate dehydratase PrpD